MRPFLAQLVLATHAAVIAFNVLGPLWCWKRPRWRAAHLLCLGLTLAFFGGRGRCPLTDAERALRGEDRSPEGFIERGLERFVYWDVRPGQVGLATGLWFGLWSYVYARRWKREAAARRG